MAVCVRVCVRVSSRLRVSGRRAGGCVCVSVCMWWSVGRICADDVLHIQIDWMLLRSSKGLQDEIEDYDGGRGSSSTPATTATRATTATGDDDGRRETENEKEQQEQESRSQARVS